MGFSHQRVLLQSISHVLAASRAAQFLGVTMKRKSVRELVGKALLSILGLSIAAAGAYAEEAPPANVQCQNVDYIAYYNGIVLILRFTSQCRNGDDCVTVFNETSGQTSFHCFNRATGSYTSRLNPNWEQLPQLPTPPKPNE